MAAGLRSTDAGGSYTKSPVRNHRGEHERGNIGDLWGAVAVQAAGTTDGRQVVAAMRGIPMSDFMTKDGILRVESAATHRVMD
jgi:hypothetical protein